MSRGLANASRIAPSVISLNVTRWVFAARDVRGLRDVPGDRLALAVEVGGEVDACRAAWRPSRSPATCLRRSSEMTYSGAKSWSTSTPNLPLPGSRAGRGRGRRRRGPGSRRRGSARSSAPWRATPRSRGSWPWRRECSTGFFTARSPGCRGSPRAYGVAELRLRPRSAISGSPARSPTRDRRVRPRGCACRKSSSSSRSSVRPRRRRRPAAGAASSDGASTARPTAARLGRDLEEPDDEVREEEHRLDLVDEDRPLAVHHPDVRAHQADVVGGRQLEQVGEQRLLVRDMDDDIADHGAMLAHAGGPSPPDGHPPDGPPGDRRRAGRIRGGRSR